MARVARVKKKKDILEADTWDRRDPNETVDSQGAGGQGIQMGSR